MSVGSAAVIDLLDDAGCIAAMNDGGFIHVNAAWTDAFGWTLETLTEQKLPGLVHPDDQAEFDDAVRSARATSEPQRLEIRVRCANGDYLPCGWKLSGDRDELILVGHVHEASSATQKLLASAFGAVGDGLCWIGEDGKIAEVNDRYVDLVGASREVLVGSFPPHPDGVAAERVALLDIATAASRGASQRSEIGLTRADHSRVRVAITGCPSPAAGGAPSLLAVRDLTREQLAERAIQEAERRLWEVAKATHGSVWLADAVGEAEWVDPCLARQVGKDQSELLGTTFDSIVADDRRGQVRAAIDSARRSMSRRVVETRLVGANDKQRPVRVDFHPVKDERDRYGGFVAVVASGQGEDSAAARPANELLDLVEMSVVGLDRHLRVTHWNEGARRTFGYTAAEATGRTLEYLLGSGDSADVSLVQGGLRDQGKWQGDINASRKDGRPVPIYAQASMLATPRGAAAAVLVAIDMSLQRKAAKQLEDARGYLGTVANSMAEGLLAIAPDGRLAYMNETAEKMLGWRLADLKGRHIHSAIQYQRGDGSGYPAHASPMVQAALHGRPASVTEDVFTRRDGTLLWVEYQASPVRAGTRARGTVVVFSDASERRRGRSQLEQELEALTWVNRVREALDHDQLVLYAQPIIDVATGATVQHELLLRMLVDGEVIAPGAFLPHAEEHGVILEVDRWVVRQAIKLAAEGNAVELNLSARSIANPTLLSEVDRCLRETGADPSKLVFEITETAMLEGQAAAVDFAAAITGLGCRLALDDFGTGYGGFTYLKRLPVHCLKIDVEFVRDLLESESSRHVVTAVVNLARSFGYQTVAEGVEQLEAVERLRELGVDRAQGYAIGRPAPVRDILPAPQLLPDAGRPARAPVAAPR